jgi:hypothetical protein
MSGKSLTVAAYGIGIETGHGVDRIDPLVDETAYHGERVWATTRVTAMRAARRAVRPTVVGLDWPRELSALMHEVASPHRSRQAVRSVSVVVKGVTSSAPLVVGERLVRGQPQNWLCPKCT